MKMFTFAPNSTSLCVKCDPMKPIAPVTIIDFLLDIISNLKNPIFRYLHSNLFAVF